MDKSVDNAKKGMRKKAVKKSIDDYLYHIVIGGFLLAVVLTFLEDYYRDRRPLEIIPVIENSVIVRHNTLSDTPYEINENDFFIDWTLQDAKAVFKTSLFDNVDMPQKCIVDNKEELRNSYDFRTEHSGCVAKSLMVNQNCSSSHVLATLSAAADRYCMVNGQRLVLSAQQLLSCAAFSCEGGSSQSVFQFMTQNPMVQEECLPYEPNSHKACNVTGCETKQVVSSVCLASKEEQVKREIQQNGPVVASIHVYRDFLLYQKGIYKPMGDMPKFQGRHQVKLIGWGVDEKRREYWIIENSWGTTWGEDGYGRVYMGFKEMLLDEFTLAPMVTKE